MNLQDTLENVDFKNLSFGLRRPLGSGRVGVPVHDSDLSGFEVIEWYDLMNKADTQTLNSCESNSFTLRVEMKKKEYGQDIQIDYNKIYDDACESLHSGWDGGLFISESLKASIEYNVLPADVFPRRIGKSIRAMCVALKKYGPLQVGLSVHEGWRASNLSPINAIDELFHPSNRNGHAVLVVGTQLYHGTELLVIANSWGWRYKFMCMTTRHFLESLLDFPCAYEFPPNFAEWEIPSEYLL